MAAEHNKGILPKGFPHKAEKLMGKNSNHKETGFSLEKHKPGFVMWGILHQLHHFRWHHQKKRLIHKHHDSSKPSADEGSSKTRSDFPEAQESAHSSIGNYAIETKPAGPKNSKKSRIKALLADEMSWRKGRRHRRSTSCPMQSPLDGTILIHQPESPSGPGPPASGIPNSTISHSHLPGPSEENVGPAEPCKLCATMLKLNHLKQSEEARGVGQDPARDHTLHESKLFMNALDLLDLRKELFLKILQDPSSSLTHQTQRRPTLHVGLTKSVSFPARGSLGRTNFEPDNNRHNFQEAKGGTQLELSENVLKKRDYGNKVVLKHFKNLQEKMKNMIWDWKKEKNPIIMDAVHHKIPFGQRISKKLTPGKLGKKPLYKRASTFNESYDRYNSLLDISLNKEAKSHTSDALSRRTTDEDNNNDNSSNYNSTHSPVPSRRAVFKRILSLPELRSYSFGHMGDSCDTGSVHAIDLEDVSGSLTEEKLVDIGLRHSNVRPLAVTENTSHENLFDVGSCFDESVDSNTWETASSYDFNESGLGSAPQPLDSGSFSEDELDYQDDEIGLVAALEDSKFLSEGNPPVAQHDSTNSSSPTTPENMADTLESQAIEKLYGDLMQLHMDPSEKPKFNYVKYILDLSGLMRDEPNAASGPMDPSMFHEAEGCFLVSKQPEDYPEKEDGAWDHLLLFDLVNEVLLDIHDRLFQYGPKPSVQWMPRGYRVLEEVWAEIRWLLSWRPKVDHSIDDGVGRDLRKGNRWMNAMDTEFVGLEVEDLIFDQLLEEIVSY